MMHGFDKKASKAVERRGVSPVIQKAHRRISRKPAKNATGAVADETATRRESHPSTDEYRGKTALVIGAGPAGMVAARYLAREGFTVQVTPLRRVWRHADKDCTEQVSEKRGDPQENPYPRTRSNLIGLRPCTVDAMLDVGIDFPEEGFKSGVHALHGNVAFGLKNIETMLPDSPRRTYIGERQSIAELILIDTQEKFKDQIALHYNRRCKRIDFEAKTAVFEEAQGEDIAIRYDLLVGADGYNSVVRQEMKRLDDSIVMKQYRCKRGYKSIRNLPLLDGDAISESLKPGFVLFGKLIGRSLVTRGVGGATGLLLYRSEYNMINGALETDLATLDAIEGKEHEWLSDVVPTYFPKEWIKEIGDQLKTAPLGRNPDVIVVSKMDGPSTVLLGDAAHTFSPNLGIGANAAIVDAKVLGDALKATDGDVEAVGRAFHGQRYDEMRALQQAQLANAFEQYFYSPTDFSDYFVGWVYKNVSLNLRQMIPNLMSKDFGLRYIEGEISSTQALFIVRRDACVFAMACTVVALVAVKFLAIPLIELTAGQSGI